MWRWAEGTSLLVPEFVLPADAERQERTAREILQRLATQPGVVLADEVGMGKTFVALAVATSVALSGGADAQPVVVMAPRGLLDKWARDFEVFRARCLPEEARGTLRLGRADRAEAFLKLADDSPERRRQIVVVSHGALSRGLHDGWVKLAIVRRALRYRRDGGELRAFIARVAPELTGMKSRGLPEGLCERLLGSDPEDWLRLLQQAGVDPEGDNNRGTDDDPVPRQVREALAELGSSELGIVREALVQAARAPGAQLAGARRQLADACKHVWSLCLGKLRLDFPLLVLDEAHHVRNAATRLARLFQSDEDSAGDQASAKEVRGALAGAFERMLFLTATPFQLGHGELCNVLERFSDTRWASDEAARGQLAERISQLRSDLNDAQASAMSLDRAWGRLSTSDLQIEDRIYGSVAHWWTAAALADAPHLTPSGRAAVEAHTRAREAMRAAEVSLRPWVIRHGRPRCFPESEVIRRLRLPGAAIALGEGAEGGLAIGHDAILPFLLAARAVTETPDKRPLFAEGLASSYEAFLETSRGGAAPLDEEESGAAAVADARLALRVQQIRRALGGSGRRAPHPKVSATVALAVDLWAQGRKVVVFCHWRRTGAVLAERISESIDRWLASRADPDYLERLGDQFHDADSRLRRACDEAATEVYRRHVALPSEEEMAQWLSVVRRFLRTPTFLARFGPGPGEEHPEELIATRVRDRRHTLARLLDVFAHSLGKRDSVQRATTLERLGRLRTGRIRRADASEAEEGDERTHHGVLPDVRLVNGGTAHEERTRLMEAFNSPFLPGILIASAVLAEGVDLHLACRHVIHHDLAWNPSTLEQRTGRVDRIGCLAERECEPIQVWLPYIAETQDERMYRVVRDREQWFRIVMGEESAGSLEAWDAERLAARLPLPEGAADSLAMDLSLDG